MSRRVALVTGASSGIGEATAVELADAGITVYAAARRVERMAEPGGFRSEWSGVAADKVRATSGTDPYAAQGRAVAESLTSGVGERMSSPPELIGRTVRRAVTARRPRTRYAVGFGAKPLIAAHTVLPDRAFDAVMRRVMGVRKG